MNTVTEFFERLLAILLGTPTIYGVSGAFLCACRKSKPVRQILLEVAGGAITTNMLAPVIQEYLPQKFHYTMFFLVGWGGLELMGRIYEIVVATLERRIQKRLQDRTDGGGDAED